MVRTDRHQPDLPPGLDRLEGAAGPRPDNRELARQSRFRLDAELVRDNALAVSGLLVAKVGGPSVKPYQPDGYWENLNFPTRAVPGRHGRRPVPARAVHLVAAVVPAPEPAGLRRPEPRGVRGRPEPLEHPAAGAGAAERPDLRRGGPRLRRADPPGRRGATPTAGSRWAWRQALQRAPRRTRNGRPRRTLVDKHRARLRGRPAGGRGAAEGRHAPRARRTSTRPSWPPGPTSPA